MCKIISIANQKGGVGKTTTAVNLGVALSIMGNSVLLIDLDPQSNLSTYVGYNVEEYYEYYPTMSDLLMEKLHIGNQTQIKECIRYSEINKIEYIPSDINLANSDLYLAGVLSRETLLKRILDNETIKNYDYVIIDCNPSLGVLLMNALTASDGIIIPVQTQNFAFDGLTALTNIIEQIQQTINPHLEIIGVLPTMVDNTNASKRVIEQLSQEYGDKLFNTVIHRATQAVESTKKHKSLCLYGKSKLGEEYKALAVEIESNYEYKNYRFY